MIRLNLGVIDTPYVTVAPAPKRVSARKAKKAQRQAPAGTMSTGSVARILEEKYGVMENFAALHKNDIAELFAASMSEAIESLAMGAPASIDPFGTATSETEQLFRNYLDQEEIAETGEEGVPTKAAMNGVNHRLKIRRGARRPSFIDTGLFQSSFKAWVE